MVYSFSRCIGSANVRRSTKAIAMAVSNRNSQFNYMQTNVGGDAKCL